MNSSKTKVEKINPLTDVNGLWDCFFNPATDLLL